MKRKLFAYFGIILIVVSLALYLAAWFLEENRCTVYESFTVRNESGSVSYIPRLLDNSKLLFIKSAAPGERYFVKANSELNKTNVAEVTGPGDEFPYGQYQIKVKHIEGVQLEVKVSDMNCVNKVKRLRFLHGLVGSVN